MVITLQNSSSKTLFKVNGIFKPLLLVVFLFCTSQAFSQDVIYTTKGDEIKCKVQEIGEDSVSFDDVSTTPPTHKFLNKKEIGKIKYANGYEEVLNSISAAVAAKTADVKATGTGTPTEDIIFTTDGKQLSGKVSDIDESTINYVLAGDATPKSINVKNVLVIKYSNGFEEFYNTPGRKPTSVDAKLIKKDEATQDKDTLFIVLQNWKRKYISPPLEIL